MTDLTVGFTEWYRLNQAIIRLRIGEVMNFGARAIETFGSTALRVAGSVEWLSKQITDLTGLTSGEQLKTLGAGAVGWLAMRHPVLAALAAAFLMLDDIRGYMEGDESLIGRFLDELDKVQAKADEIREVKDYGIPFIPDEWIEQIYNFDEALQRIIGRPPDLNPWQSWNFTSDVLAPAWKEFEAWWDQLVQGFHDAGARSGAALLDGLMTIGAQIRDWFASLIPEWARGWVVNVDPVAAPTSTAVDPSRAHERFRGETVLPEIEVIPSPFDPAGIRNAIQRLMDGAANFITGGLDSLPIPAQAAAANAGGGQFDRFREGIENMQANLARMSPEAAAQAVVNDNSVANDSRDQSVTVNSTINQTVQQAAQAPRALAEATSRVVGQAAAQNRTLLNDEPSF